MESKTQLRASQGVWEALLKLRSQDKNLKKFECFSGCLICKIVWLCSQTYCIPLQTWGSKLIKRSKWVEIMLNSISPWCCWPCSLSSSRPFSPRHYSWISWWRSCPTTTTWRRQWKAARPQLRTERRQGTPSLPARQGPGVSVILTFQRRREMERGGSLVTTAIIYMDCILSLSLFW